MPFPFESGAVADGWVARTYEATPIDGTRLAVSLAAVAMATGLVGCIDDPVAAEEDLPLQGIAGDPTDILTNADYYAGGIVRLDTELDEVLTDRAFTVAGIDSAELLVVHDGSFSPVGDSSLTVTGKVVRSLQGPLLQDLIEEGLSATRTDGFARDPYIAASDIDPEPADDECCAFSHPCLIYWEVHVPLVPKRCQYSRADITGTPQKAPA